MEYAFSQVGLSAEGALAAVEGVAKAINLSPGNAGLLAAFGINPNEDRTKATIDLLNYLHKNFSTPVGYQFAQRFGIDYNTFMADTNKLQAAFAQRDALLTKDGRDPNKEAVLANELQTHRRELDARFADLRYKAMEDFLPIGKQILDWTDKAVTWFNQLDAATNGWALRIGAVVTALGALKVSWRYWHAGQAAGARWCRHGSGRGCWRGSWGRRSSTYRRGRNRNLRVTQA